MMRKTTVIWALLSVVAGVWMFVIKHQIQSLEDELRRLERAIVAEQEAIHVLAAEWSYLNQPARLDGLGRRLMGLVPMSSVQHAELDDLRRALEAPDPMAAPEASGPAHALRVDAAARPEDRLVDRAGGWE